MAKLPTAEDLKKARAQATHVVADALEQARTPLYAVLGAGDLATEAVRDYVAKVRTDATGQAKDVQTDVQTRANDLQARLTELQDRLVEVRAQVRTRVNELPDEVAELRGKLEAGELRHALENYVQSLQDLYERLATRGETTVDKLKHNPQVMKAMDRVEDVADTTEDRVGKFVEDARELTYEVLGRVGRRTRSATEQATEQAADRTEQTTDQVSGAVQQAGGNAAEAMQKVADAAAEAAQKAGEETASATRKAGAATAPKPPKPTKAATTPRKPAAPRKAGSKA